MRRGAIGLLAVLSACVATAGPPQTVAPPQPESAEEQRLAQRYGAFVLSRFQRRANQVRVDVFHHRYGRELSRVAEALLRLRKANPQRLVAAFHVPFGGDYGLPPWPARGTDTGKHYPAIAVLGGSAPDPQGQRTEAAGIRTLPKARLAYHQYVWVIPLQEVPNATQALLERVTDSR